MKTIFGLALSACLMTGAGYAQQQPTIIGNVVTGEFPILVRAADGTVMRCRAGTTVENFGGGLACEQTANGGQNFGNANAGQATIGLGATGAAIGGVILLGVALGSSPGT